MQIHLIFPNSVLVVISLIMAALAALGVLIAVG